MDPHSMLASVDNHIPQLARKHTALSSLDNRGDLLEQRRLNHANKPNSDRTQQSSVYTPIKSDEHESSALPQKHYTENMPCVQENRPTLSIIQQSFKTTHNDRVQPIRQRPSVGGKSVATAKQARGRKRLSPEQLQQLSRRIDPTQPVDLHRSPTKPALPELNTSRKRSRLRFGGEPDVSACHEKRPSLLKKCVDIWPGASSLGELSHDNIQNLSDLLKVRLSQAKFRVLATLESNDAFTAHNRDLYSCLQKNERVSTPPPASMRPMRLLSRRHKPAPSATPIGNGKNLFVKRQTQSLLSRQGVSHTNDASGKLSAILKSHKQYSFSGKFKKERETPAQKSRSRAADVSPITLDDGSRVFVCDPCNKRYKNRNGLAYHLERCKYQPEDDEDIEDNDDNIDDDEGGSSVNCICSKPNDDKGLMVQCDQCRSWLHLDCLGLSEDSLDDVFHCPRCNECTPRSRPIEEVNKTDDFKLLPRKKKSLLQDLEEAQNSSENEDAEGKRPLNPSIFNIFSENSTPHVEPNFDNTSVGNNDGTSNEMHPHVWNDLTLPIDAAALSEPWSQLSEDEPFSNLSNGPSWTDMSLMQPPSLLFSDNTLGSILDEDLLAMTPGELDSTPLPSDVVLPSDLSADHDPLPEADALWFEFANFEDDFQFTSPRSP